MSIPQIAYVQRDLVHIRVLRNGPSPRFFSSSLYADSHEDRYWYSQHDQKEYEA